MRFLSLVAALVIAVPTLAVAEVERAKLEAFIEVTGYDVIIESLKQGAMAGPGMTGNASSEFGRQYEALADEVFNLDEMENRALDIMQATMTPELVDFGADFYASELGQRLVEVENAAHLADDSERMAEGGRLVEEMAANDETRLELMKELATAVSSTDVAIRALVEMQVRFTMAAIGANALDIGLSEEEIRARAQDSMDAMRPQIEAMGVIGNAYTYRAMSNEDVLAYLNVLKSDEMQQIYEVLNAVQYQLMIERYQMLGARLGELKPETDL